MFLGCHPTFNFKLEIFVYQSDTFKPMIDNINFNVATRALTWKSTLYGNFFVRENRWFQNLSTCVLPISRNKKRPNRLLELFTNQPSLILKHNVKQLHKTFLLHVWSSSFLRLFSSDRRSCHILIYAILTQNLSIMKYDTKALIKHFKNLFTFSIW